MRIWLLVACFVCSFALSGCETLQDIAAGLDKPSARIVDSRLVDLTVDGVVLDFGVEVTNPYELGLPLTDLGYRISSDGRELLSGEAASAGTIPAGGSRVIQVPVAVTFADLFDVVRGLRPGDVVPYRAEFDVKVDAPGDGSISIPLQRSGKMPVPAIPAVRLDGLEWQNLSFDDATAVVSLAVDNPNSFRLDIGALDLGLELAGHRVVESVGGDPIGVGAGKSRTVDIPISFAPKDLGLAAFNMLTGSSADYRLAGNLDVVTPFGPIAMPVERVGSLKMK
jgi:LEA14-like dessication related protein